jgi:hypothetical protein
MPPELTSEDVTMADPNTVIMLMLHFPSCRFVLITLLQLVQVNLAKIQNWAIVWSYLGILRDSTLLPPQLVLEVEPDFLP